MIANNRQLNSTRRKLARLQERVTVIERRLQSEPDRDTTRVTLDSYRRLIRQLQEEITRYELGIEPPSQDRLDNDEQLRSAVGKLESLQRLEEKHTRDQSSRTRNINLLSLRQTIKQLQEEIAWYQAHRDQPTHASHTEIR